MPWAAQLRGGSLRTIRWVNRLLGSTGEADDAVQEAWLRVARADTNDIQNIRAWLNTVLARVCLDMLRSRTARREVHLDTPLPADSPDPEQEAMLADSVGLALLDPDVTVRADPAAAPAGTPTHLRGAQAVARQALAFSRKTKHAHTGLVNGTPAILITPCGYLATVMTFTITRGKIVTIDIIADPRRLGRWIEAGLTERCER
jgi:hypothetical protein